MGMLTSHAHQFLMPLLRDARLTQTQKAMMAMPATATIALPRFTFGSGPVEKTRNCVAG